MKLNKADEMELSINSRAMKWAWFYTVSFLFIWAVYDYINNGDFNSLAFFLFITQNLIYLAISLFLKWKLGKDEK